MPCNVGPADRVLRLGLGAILLLLPLLTGFAAGIAWPWWGAIIVGLVMLATAGTRVCPLYRLLGLRTCAP